MITVESVALDDTRAGALWEEQQRELWIRYGEPDTDADFALDMPPDAMVTSLLAVTDAGEAVGTALVRWSPYPTGAGSAEVKRLYVAPGHRGRGHSRVLMGAAERAALGAGAVRVVLETGSEQPEALGLYEGIGYSRITPYGPYKDDHRSVCFAKDLPTRVLVVNGSIGAGKTKTAAAIFDVLGERGTRVAMIDGDFLCQAAPASGNDGFGQDLLFANLAAVAPVYRRFGYGIMVIARVVEDPEDCTRYAHAFAAAGQPAQVTIARVTAPEAVRKARIVHRDVDPAWHQWGHARTVELDAVLEDLNLDDVVVVNADRTPVDSAREIIEALGW